MFPMKVYLADLTYTMLSLATDAFRYGTTPTGVRRIIEQMNVTRI